MGFTQYLKDTFVPTEKPAAPDNVYDIPKTSGPARIEHITPAKFRHESVDSSSRRSSTASIRTSDWQAGQAIPFSIVGNTENNVILPNHVHHHHQGKKHSHGDFRMAD